MGLFSDSIHYDKTSGSVTMTTPQKNALHNAYRRYAKRIFRENKQRTRLKYNTPDQTVEVRFSTGAFVNSDEYQNLVVVKKHNLRFTEGQQETIAKKAATLLRKDGFKVSVYDYGTLELYKK